MRWQQTCFWKKKKHLFEKCKLKKFACAHVFAFEDLILTLCVLPAGLPPSIFRLSQSGALSPPIKVRLPVTPASPGLLH